MKSIKLLTRWVMASTAVSIGACAMETAPAETEALVPALEGQELSIQAVSTKRTAGTIDTRMRVNGVEYGILVHWDPKGHGAPELVITDAFRAVRVTQRRETLTATVTRGTEVARMSRPLALPAASLDYRQAVDAIENARKTNALDSLDVERFNAMVPVALWAAKEWGTDADAQAAARLVFALANVITPEGEARAEPRSSRGALLAASGSGGDGGTGSSGTSGTGNCSTGTSITCDNGSKASVEGCSCPNHPAWCKCSGGSGAACGCG